MPTRPDIPFSAPAFASAGLPQVMSFAVFVTSQPSVPSVHQAVHLMTSLLRARRDH